MARSWCSTPGPVQRSSFRPVNGSAAWTTDDGSIVTQSRAFALWDVATTYDTKHVAAVVREHLTWTVAGDSLVWIKGRVRGRVMRGGVPIAGASIVAEIRRPPDLEGGSISNESTRGQLTSTTAITNDDGEFELDELFPGQYTLRARSGATRANPIEVRVGATTADVLIELPEP